ncbi:hypothetical protein KC678_02080 [Candidatus Dojkabacteria bacterium]|uniref:Uncharacterized protein n=1 Tax=Candidatus Dojkabacteria bacterium TaxID=2099670 RepID=A0A955IF70_9BACT|nr:hypothetical protein [Candidatus Dojkabacteria bacterium]
MKNKKGIFDMISVVAILISLFVILNPLHFFMPSKTQMIFEAIFFIVVCVYLVFFQYEKALDERESYHLMISSRISTNIAIVLLLIALINELFGNNSSSFIPLTIAAIVLSKIISLWYFRSRK